MPTRIKGNHAFRASNDSVGAAHTLAGSVSGVPVNKSGGHQPEPLVNSVEAEEEGEHLDTELSNHHTLPVMPISPSPPPPRSQSTITSTSTSNSNKRKRSALDDMISTSGGGTSEGGSNSKRSALKPSGPVALNAVAAQLGEFTSRFEKAMAPRPAARRTETSPERRMAAIKRLQMLEAEYLDLDRLIALVDYFKSSSDAAATYLSLDLPILRRGWLEKQLTNVLGFPQLSSTAHSDSSSGPIQGSFSSSNIQ